VSVEWSKSRKRSASSEIFKREHLQFSQGNVSFSGVLITKRIVGKVDESRKKSCNSWKATQSRNSLKKSGYELSCIA
jgi:uncharacterized protein YggL (DUF469 family)